MVMARATHEAHAVVTIPPGERTWANGAPGARMILDDVEGLVVALDSEAKWDVIPMAQGS